MDARIERKAGQQRRRSSWKGVVLPTIIIIGFAMVGAAPIRVDRHVWKTVASANVSLDSKSYRLTDDTAGWCALLGLQPDFFVQYDTPEGRRNWIVLASEKGHSEPGSVLPVIDKDKQSVRYLLMLKDNRRVVFDESSGHTVTGTTANGQGRPFAFTALTVPREGVQWSFHPGEVKEIRLQVRNRPVVRG